MADEARRTLPSDFQHQLTFRIGQIPVINGMKVDLYMLHKTVNEKGVSHSRMCVLSKSEDTFLVPQEASKRWRRTNDGAT